ALANPRKHELAQPVALAPARVSDDRKPRSIEREARPAERDSGVEPPREEALDPVVARQPDDVETADAGADDEGDRPGRPGREGGQARALLHPGRDLRPPPVRSGPRRDRQISAQRVRDVRPAVG